MSIRRLKTVNDIIEVIGRPRVAALTGASTNAITNWKADGYIPPRFYDLISSELKRRGCSAPKHLLGQVGAPASRAA